MHSANDSVSATLGHANQIACFSVSNAIVTANSTTSLQYFKEPTPGLPLSYGCNEFLRRYKSDLSIFHPLPLDNIFTALNCSNKEIFRHADVLTWRGIVVKLVVDHHNY
jgi:hypothetical protein